MKWLGRLWGTVKSWTPEQTWKCMNLVEPSCKYEITIMRDMKDQLHVLHPMTPYREGMMELAETLQMMARLMAAQAQQMPSIQPQPQPRIPMAPSTTTASVVIQEETNGHAPVPAETH